MLLLLLAVGLAPIAAIGSYLLVSERAATIDAVAADLDLRAREGVVLLQQRVLESRTAIEAVAVNPVIRSDVANDEDWQAQLDTIRRLYPDFDDITIVTPDGRAAASTDYAFSGAWSSKQWFAQALEGRGGMSAPHMAGLPLHLVVVFASPVRRASDDSVIAVVAGQVALESLARPLRAVHVAASTAGDHGSLCLLDNRGLVLAGPPGAQPLSPAPPGLVSADPGVRLLMGSFWRTAVVPELGWIVAGQIERSVVVQKTNALAARIAVGGLAVALTVALLAFLLSSRLSSTVGELSKVIDRIGDGQLDHRLAPFGLFEVDRLVGAFNAMATRLQETQAEVARSEEWFRSLVVRGSDVVWVLDRDLCVTYVSPSALRVFGVDHERLVGVPFLELVPEPDRPRLQRAIARGHLEGDVEHGLRGLPADVILESSVSDLTDVPAVQGLVIHTRDITDRKALEADVERALELDRLKTEFVGLASHELRTPLTGIYGFSELLMSSPRLSEEELRWVGTINGEAERLREIIEGLLSVSRIEAGAFSVDLQPVSMRAVIEEALRSGEPISQEPHEIVTNIDEDVQVWADRRRLVEVVENVVGNAVKYSPRGGRIEVGVTRRGDVVCLTVADHGLGIPEGALGTLFERFKRVDTPDRASIRGTGLGLYLVKRYVDSFGGRIDVESEVGVGSTFTVTLTTATVEAAA